MTISHENDHFYVDVLNRESGDAASDQQDDWQDENTRVHPNHWSTAQTSFRVSEAPIHKRDKFEDLKQWHDGKGEQDRRTTIRQAKIEKDTGTFCAICNLPDYQHQRVNNIIQTSDISSNNYGGKSYEKVILAVMSLIVDESIESTDEMDTRLILQDEFRDLMESVDLGSSELRRIRQMIRERTDRFEGA